MDDRREADEAIESPGWQVASAWAGSLLDGGRLPWSAWRAAGRVQVVKDAPHRTVYRVDLPARGVYLKHYRCLGLARALRASLFGSASRREYEVTLELRRRQVPTFEPVAVAERRAGGLVRDSFLVTAAIDDSLTLEEVARRELLRLAPAARARLRQRLARSLAQLCAAAHRAGVAHGDLHAGNVLIRRSELAADRSEAELFLIDLAAVRCGRSLSRRRSLRNLVMLGGALRSETTRGERLRFWRAYCRARPEFAPRSVDRRQARAEERRLLAWLEDAIDAQRRRVLCGRDERALRRNREFELRTTGQHRAHTVRELAPEAVAELLAEPWCAVRRGLDRPLKLSPASIVVQSELRTADGLREVVWKRFRARGLFKAMCDWFRASRARRAWVLGHALLARGIATPRPLAAVLDRRRRLFREEYLATAYVAGGRNLHLFAWELQTRPAEVRRRRAQEAAVGLGALLGRLHAWQFEHRDLKGGNLLLEERAEGVKAWLIDLDGLRPRRRLSRRARLENLARLAVSVERHPWVSHGERLRFLRAYLAELAAPREDWKTLWREVGVLLARRLAAKRARGAELA